MAQPSLFKMVLAWRKTGQSEKALVALRDALRRGQIEPEATDAVGRFIQQELRARAAESTSSRVLLLGQCTTSWLATTLTAVAWSHNVPVVVHQGTYDNILQDLIALQRASGRVDVVVLVPWNERLLGGGASAGSQRIEDELVFWRQAWSLVSGRLEARLLQVGYDWVTAGAGGHHLAGKPDGRVFLVRAMNAALRDNLPTGSFFLDLEQCAGVIGRESFYDERRYFWTKQPFSERGTYHLAKHLWAGIRALTTGPKKVLAVDLDNTLWGGVVGEAGPLDIALGDTADGQAYRAFQSHLKDLSRRGILLAVASKNNLADAREAFEMNPDMVLRLDEFAAFEVSWEPKSVMLERIARNLNLGLDSFVFFDDNPAEREQIRQMLPEVDVVEVPEEPAEYVRALEGGLWFETTMLDRADRDRAQQYQIEKRRLESQGSFSSIAEYLDSLQMQADVRRIDEADMPRVVQLLAKTNQFNLTTRRHTREELLSLVALPRAIPLTLRAEDRFGDYGLVSVMLGIPWSHTSPEAVRIDTWLMSCRVIGRTIEHFFFEAFLDRSKTLGFRRIVGEFIPTQKNSLVQGLYEQMGFARIPDQSDGIIRYELNVETARLPATFVKLKGERVGRHDS